MRERRAAERASRLEELERSEAAALMSDDQAAIDAAHAEYALLEAEEAADEDEALARGDVRPYPTPMRCHRKVSFPELSNSQKPRSRSQVLHVVEGQLQIDLEVPSDEEGMAALRSEFIAELAEALGVAEEQLVGVSFEEEAASVASE